MALLGDLDELACFKERLATHHLLARHAEFVPALLSARAKAEAALDEANERLAFIGSRSTTDVATDVVVIPAQFAAENVERLTQRAKAERDLAKVRKLLSRVTAELQVRLADERLRGRAGLPKLRLLKMPPDVYAGLEDAISDARIESRVAELERMLGARIVTPGRVTVGTTDVKHTGSGNETALPVSNGQRGVQR
jgi:hypothetical protein